MSNKVRLPADGGYIANINGIRKAGKTISFYRRFGKSQYNQGGVANTPDYAYICYPGYESHWKRWEKLYKREYHFYLKRHKKNNKKVTEWIDEKFTHIDCEHIMHTMDDIVRKENLQIRKIKTEYISRIVDDPNFINQVRENIDKYTDAI
jgi:hypothetical protein